MIAGDGTTTATILASAIYAKGAKNVAACCNPWISAHTKTTTITAKIAQVATISANGNKHVSNLRIVQAMEKVGKEGVITIKEGCTIENGIDGCSSIVVSSARTS